MAFNSISLFQGASDVNIANSTFNLHLNANYFHNNLGFDRLFSATAPAALHNSDERLDPPKCHPNTRVAVLQRLMEWATRKIDAEKSLMWLYGPAGAGKSAIAHTLAEMCSKEGYLLASFIFRKTIPSCNTYRPLIATISYQLAMAIPETRPILDQILISNPMVLNQSLQTQITQLIINPLLNLAASGFAFSGKPFLVIIDGLDECESGPSGDVQAHIVNALATAATESPYSLRFLIASRPEMHIEIAFNSLPVTSSSILATLVLDDRYEPYNDIYRYLEDSFDEIKRTHVWRSGISADWPTPKVIEELARKSSGQFIYASLVIGFVKSYRHRPTDRLNEILGLKPLRNVQDMPFAEIDILYRHLLSTSPDIELTLDVLAAKVFGRCQRAEEVDDLFGLTPGDTVICLNGHLASVVHVFITRVNGVIMIHHASFIDFLLDSRRSKEFYLDRRIFRDRLRRRGLPNLVKKIAFSQHGLWDFQPLDPNKEKIAWLSPDLENDLKDFSIRDAFASCVDGNGVFERFWHIVPYMVNYISKAGATDLYEHHRAACEEIFSTFLDSCPFFPSVFLSVASIVFSATEEELYSGKYSLVMHIRGPDPILNGSVLFATPPGTVIAGDKKDLLYGFALCQCFMQATHL